jgi:hypothetical protein
VRSIGLCLSDDAHVSCFVNDVLKVIIVMTPTLNSDMNFLMSMFTSEGTPAADLEATGDCRPI